MLRTFQMPLVKSDIISVLAKQRRGCLLEDATSKQTYSKVLIFVSLNLKVILLPHLMKEETKLPV